MGAAVVYNEALSSYQYPATLSIGDLVYWQLSAVNGDAESSNWSETISFVIPVSLGDNYAGGIVFYLNGVNGGLVSAVSDQSSGIQWYNGSYSITGASSTGIGTGNANTVAIVTAQGNGSYAAKLCYDLILNGYSDWFLPSKDELILMRELYGVIGGFSSFNYWSSSESDSDFAWVKSFYSGVVPPDLYWKHDSHKVRAIRAFNY